MPPLGIVEFGYTQESLICSRNVKINIYLAPWEPDPRGGPFPANRTQARQTHGTRLPPNWVCSPNLIFAASQLISGLVLFFSRAIMTEPKNAENAASAAQATDHTAEDVAAVFADPGAQAPNGEPDPFVVLENLQLENAGLKDKILRTLADMENLRRRTEKEIADAKTYGVTSFARDMLTFADNLRRAVESVPTDAKENASAPVKSFLEGIELTERDFASRLAKYGVKKLEPQGAKFDPNLHEALYEIPDESVPNGTVLQVVESGYSIGERVLRPAKVGISRGSPKA